MMGWCKYTTENIAVKYDLFSFQSKEKHTKEILCKKKMQERTRTMRNTVQSKSERKNITNTTKKKKNRLNRNRYGSKCCE